MENKPLMIFSIILLFLVFLAVFVALCLLLNMWVGFPSPKAAAGISIAGAAGAAIPLGKKFGEWFATKSVIWKAKRNARKANKDQ